MTHEYKHYIDLSQFEGHVEGEWKLESVKGWGTNPTCITSLFWTNPIATTHSHPDVFYTHKKLVRENEIITYFSNPTDEGEARKDAVIRVERANGKLLASSPKLLAYARELETRVNELEIRDVSATHMIMDADFKKHEMSLRIADLERQLAERDMTYSDAVADAAKRLLSGDLLWGQNYLEPMDARLKHVLKEHLVDERIAELKRHLSDTLDENKELNAANVRLGKALTEATTWRSPETAPRDGTVIVGKFPETLADIEYLTINAVFYSVDDVTGWDTGGDLFADDELLGWFPLPETKKEDV